jgi:hypothetical protein
MKSEGSGKMDASPVQAPECLVRLVKQRQERLKGQRRVRGLGQGHAGQERLVLECLAARSGDHAYGKRVDFSIQRRQSVASRISHPYSTGEHGDHQRHHADRLVTGSLEIFH